MSMRVEWLDADHTSISLAESGQEIGDNEVESYAIILEQNEAIVIAGDLAELQRFTDRIVAQLASLRNDLEKS